MYMMTILPYGREDIPPAEAFADLRHSALRPENMALPPPPARWRLLPTSSAFNCPPPSLLAEALGFDWPSPDRSATSGMPAMGLAAPRSQAHFFGRAASGTNPKRQRWRAVPASDTSP